MLGYSRYTDEESLNFMLEASALDPRFKRLTFHSEEEREPVCSRLVTRTQAINTTEVILTLQKLLVK